MISKTVFVFLLILTATLWGQALDASSDLSHLMKKAPAHWWDIAYGCSELAPEFFARGELDSLTMLLEYWEENTTYYEPIRRLWMLLQINDNSFDTSFITPAVVEDMYAYQDRSLSKADTSDWYLWSGDKSSAMVSSTFNQFTKKLATDLLQYDDLSDDEWLICLFYSDQFKKFWHQFESGSVRHTALYRQFHRDYKQNTARDIHYEVFSGGYWPKESLALFGNKIIAGGSIGLDVDRVLIDGTLLFRGLDSASPYRIKYLGETFETNHYFGVYLGLDPSFCIYDWGRMKIDLLAGIALDIVEAVPMEENPFGEDSIDLLSSNINAGLGARFYPFKGKPYYIRAQMRYELASYDSHGGTSFSGGEAFSFRLGFGWHENRFRFKMARYFKED